MNINSFVSDFLNEYDKTGLLLKKWTSVKNQRKLKKFLKDNQKDPLKPKRGKSGFLYFCDEQRPILKENNKNITVKEIVSQLGKLWRQLKDDNETEKYDLLSIQDRDRYRDEMVTYKKKKGSHSPVVKSKKDSKETALQLYVKSKTPRMREKNPSVADGAIEKSLKEKWKRLPLAKRMKYIQINSENNTE